jgi:hypothetical protein
MVVSKRFRIKQGLGISRDDLLGPRGRENQLRLPLVDSGD